MDMCMNEINSERNEQKHVHLSNGLIQSYEVHYMFRV